MLVEYVKSISQWLKHIVDNVSLQLVDRKKDRLQENLRVQDNLEKAKMARRPIIRYIQVGSGQGAPGVLNVVLTW